MSEQGVELVGTEEPTVTRFSLRTAPVLSAGRFDHVLARNDSFAARVKVYAEGGENASHTHLREDHLFLVLAGAATFHLGRDGEDVQVLGCYEGLFLPRGAFYRFASSGDENLVLFRVGSFDAEDRKRVGPDGRPLHGGSKENRHIVGVPVEGRYFGD